MNREPEDQVKQAIADTVGGHVDHVEFDDGGPVLIVLDGMWFEVEVKQVPVKGVDS